MHGRYRQMNWDEIMEIKNPNEAFLAIEKKIWEEDLSLEEMENRIEEYLNRHGIDIETMTQIRKIPVGINLHRIRADKYGKLWVSSRGDYEKIPSRLFVLEKDKRTNRMEVRDTLNVSCSEMDICGDSLYLYSVEWSNISQENNVTYGIIDVRTGELISNSFIKDGTETDIEIPYGLKVNPETGDVYVTDAKNYVSSGNLHCYGRDGIRKWSVRTGDIPAHMAFLYKNK